MKTNYKTAKISQIIHNLFKSGYISNKIKKDIFILTFLEKLFLNSYLNEVFYS